jgi:hypothetical protein
VNGLSLRVGPPRERLDDDRARRRGAPGAAGRRGAAAGRQVGGDTVWLDEIDVSRLPGPARAALDRGEHTDLTLQTALLGVVRAEVDRGA